MWRASPAITGLAQKTPAGYTDGLLGLLPEKLSFLGKP
jgi:hypothetical protein